jgi:SAM-dependent methyltransferase
VLDAGCAAGDHAAWLVAQGARVVALDASAAMVALARARLGAAAQVELADLNRPLPFDDGAFDLIVSSLTLHYLADWVPTLREFARVLRRPGRLVLSTHHPFLTVDLVDDYDAVTLVEEGWAGFGDAPVPVRFYHRSLARILGELAAGGFTLREFEEVRPSVEADARDPELAARLRARPAFLVLDAGPA